MRSAEEFERGRALLAEGLSPGAVSRLTGTPRSTIRDWQSGAGCGRTNQSAPDPLSLPRVSYAYLLGIYLGDGHIAGWRKGLFHLRVFCYAAYPGIVDEIATAIRTVRRRDTAIHVTRRPGMRCFVVQNLWRHWPSVLPQHGPGLKHTREIALLEWQQTITFAEPHAFVRGLIHSDGCRFVAHQRRGEKTYAYVRYSFANASEDIKAILCEHLDLLGIHWIRPNAKNIDVNRRADVEKLESFIGPKS